MKKQLLINFRLIFSAFLNVVLAGTAFVSQNAFSGVIIVPSQDEIKIPIDKQSGSLLQLPGSVRTITPSSYFEIVDVGSDLDKSSGVKVDVRLFQVRPLAGARAEQVTFILGNGRSIKTQLLPTDGADKHYDLLLADSSKKRKDPRFLNSEIAMMGALLRDESGDYAREVKDTSVSLSGLGGFEATLIRSFAGNGLAGYIFRIRNKSSAPAIVDASMFQLGSAQNPAVLSHAEKERLEACGLLAKQECEMRLFIVTRGERYGKMSLQKKNISSNAPFVRAAAQPEDGLNGAHQ